MFRLTDAAIGLSAVAGVTTAIALLADPSATNAQMVALEQRGANTVCEQLPKGAWRCTDDLPRVVWSANQ